jgi:alkaline phosphatase
LFIGDGTTQGMITAARLVSRGMDVGGYKGQLAIDKLSQSPGTMGLLAPSGMDAMITDSANSASSYNTGHKVYFLACFNSNMIQRFHVIFHRADTTQR